MIRSKSAGGLLVGLCLLAQATTAFAYYPPVGVGSGGCDSCGGKVTCPPFLKYVFEGAPKIKFKRGCPRPICDPCNLDHFGYYQTCWSPWPYEANWSHCPYPTAATMLPPPAVPPYTPKVAIPVTPDRVPEKAKPTDKPMKPMTPKIPDLPSPKPLEGDRSSYSKPTVRLINVN